MKNKVKSLLVPGVYVIAIFMFGFSLYYVQKLLSSSILKARGIDINSSYVDDEIIENHEYLPVVGNEKVLIKPFTSSDVVVSRSFYDYNGESESQEKSIIYYENTYMQNSGIDYSCDNSFDVVSISDGVVIDVKTDSVMGTSVEIRHNNELISVYQSLSDINVKVDDAVYQGQILGKSGKSNLNLDNENNLHFELYYMGEIVNPELYYDKSLTDL